MRKIKKERQREKKLYFVLFICKRIINVYSIEFREYFSIKTSRSTSFEHRIDSLELKLIPEINRILTYNFTRDITDI